jgi:hypothetical protein
MLILFLIIVNHFVADFLCQTDKMAINKSTSNKWLTLHVITYMTAMLPSVAYIDFMLNNGFSFHINGNLGATSFYLVNFALHWITDYFTSRASSYLYMKSQSDPNGKFLKESWRHWFFSVVGLDQLIHYGCLFFTFQYFMNH